LVPKQLDFLRKEWVGKSIDAPQRTSLACVEMACSCINVLRFDLQLDASLCSGPCFGCGKECFADTMASDFGCHAKIPDHGQVLAPFQHIHAFRVKSDDYPSDSSTVDPSRI